MGVRMYSIFKKYLLVITTVKYYTKGLYEFIDLFLTVILLKASYYLKKNDCIQLLPLKIVMITFKHSSKIR